MPYEDYLMRQVNSLENVFKKIFSKLLLLNNSVAAPASISEISELLKLATGLHLNEIANSTNDELLARLLEKKLSSSDLNSIINILIDLAKMDNPAATGYEPDQLLSKAVFIDNYIAKNRKIAYFNNFDSSIG